jgi:signal transduction histidine kinase
MSRIVTDLFTLAKLDMRQYALQKERVALRPLLEEARETWQVPAAERKVEIRIEGADVPVAGDPVALRRVFMNLIENAVKYNRAGGQVRITIGRDNGRAKISVVDSGIGIGKEHLPRLFRRFYRADKGRSRENGGAGLGLAICKAFIEAHEGTIDVDSTPGAGTTFRISLPASD